MDEFISLIAKITPLYLIVAIGYLAGTKLKADRTTIASILIYIISPVVVFNGVTSAPQTNTYLLLPVVSFLTASSIAVAFYAIGGYIWRSSERNLLGFVAGTGNTGYFGIPLVLSLYGTEALSIVVFYVMGTILYEGTTGYYLMAKSNATSREAFKKVLKLPIIYAFIVGFIVNRLGIQLSDSLTETLGYFNGAFVVLGMMILGVGLAGVRRSTFDLKFTSITFLAKFLFYPLITAGLVVLDSNVLGIFSDQVHRVAMIMAIVPMAINTVTYASYLKANPEKAALTVLLSTLFALIYIPTFITLFLK